MAPTFNKIYDNAATPYMNNKISAEDAVNLQVMTSKISVKKQGKLI